MFLNNYLCYVFIKSIKQASTVAKHEKLPPAVPASLMALVPLPAAPLSIQLPANMPGKAANNSPGPFDPAFMWETKGVTSGS